MFVGNLSGRSIKLQPKMDKKESLKKLTFTKKTKHNFMRNRLCSPSFVKAQQVRHTTNELVVQVSTHNLSLDFWALLSSALIENNIMLRQLLSQEETVVSLLKILVSKGRKFAMFLLSEVESSIFAKK